MARRCRCNEGRRSATSFACGLHDENRDMQRELQALWRLQVTMASRASRLVLSGFDSQAAAWGNPMRITRTGPSDGAVPVLG